jgi:hypothetical protein
LPVFTKRIETWLRENVDLRIAYCEPPISHSPAVARPKARLPLSFNVEFGAYINAIRSSLDILATALAIRYRIDNSEDAYFSVAKSAAAFASGNYKGSKFIKRLPTTERTLIEELKPYKGGNEPLFELHHLDIVRKHRRLIDVQVSPASFAISGPDPALRKFVPIAPLILPVDQETVLGFIWNGTSDYKIKIVPQIAISEGATASTKPVISSLSEFASLVNSIIRLFDT